MQISQERRLKTAKQMFKQRTQHEDIYIYKYINTAKKVKLGLWLFPHIFNWFSLSLSLSIAIVDVGSHFAAFLSSPLGFSLFLFLHSTQTEVFPPSSIVSLFRYFQRFHLFLFSFVRSGKSYSFSCFVCYEKP